MMMIPVLMMVMVMTKLVASIIYLTYPTLHAPVEWQNGRVAEVGGRVR